MNYQIKSLIQNFIALLPNNFSNNLYFFLQRRLGNLKKFVPDGQFQAAIKIKKILDNNDRKLNSSKLLEIGSGRCPITSISLWLLGAESITTVDINFYFRKEIFSDFVNWLEDNKYFLIKRYPEILKKRLDIFLGINWDQSMDEILIKLRNLGINYIAPCDASSLNIEDNYFEYQFSYNVIEHVPPYMIEKIFLEFKRVLKKDSLLINNIDYTDHFAHSDKNISPINFLRFSNFTFSILAGNKFMYMNRLRDDDIQNIFKKLKLKIIHYENFVDSNIKNDIYENKLKLDKRFINKNPIHLATLESWYCLKIEK